MDRTREVAPRLLAAAREDAIAARLLAGSPDVTHRSVGLHAQQAVEKSLKAVLARRGIAYPRTHDLGTLAQEVARALGTADIPNADDMLALTHYAGDLRYGENPAPATPSLTNQDMVAIAQTLVDWAEALMTAFEEA